MAEEYRTKFNNFHGWFPGGFYRGEGLCSKTDEQSQDLIKDVDQVLEEMQFDILTYQRLRGGSDYIFHEVLDLAREAAKDNHRKFTEEEKKRKEMLFQEGDLVNKRLDNMMEPVFNKLIEKGHSRGELIV